MSVTSADATRTNGAHAAAGGGRGLPEASLADSGKIVAAALVPALVRGLFKPRKGALKGLTRIDADRRTVEVLSAVRRKHPGQGVRILGGRMAVLWGEDAIRQVLDGSADAYDSGAGAKEKGMRHFQPDALTLSHGEEWRDRRAFADSVLAYPERVHPLAGHWLAIVADEVDYRLRIGPTMEWDRFERLFDRLTLRVIFGNRSRDDQAITEGLARLMEQANNIVGAGDGDSDEYHELIGRLERKLIDPEPDSLVARIAGAPQTDRTRVVQQIPHWIFAMRDTLGANVYRALAAIVSNAAVERRVREEIEDADLDDVATVDGLRYLEGCLHEAMRLWPTTPLLARETTREVELAGERLEEGTQVMIVNTFNHRDAEHVPDADRLVPERWTEGFSDYRLNHLSNGAQDCPGGPMVLFLGKAVLARLLREYDVKLAEPRIEPDRLPHSLDFYATRFEVKRRTDA